jgi:hypothetical protein
MERQLFSPVYPEIRLSYGNGNLAFRFNITEEPYTTEEGEEAIGYRFDEIILTEGAETLSAKQQMSDLIHEYGSSEKVDHFVYQGQKIWLDKATRAGLKLRFESEKALGIEETSLWLGTQEFHLKVSDAIQMLFLVEQYASACFDNESSLKREVEQAETLEEILAVNIYSGYPEELIIG